MAAPVTSDMPAVEQPQSTDATPPETERVLAVDNGLEALTMLIHYECLATVVVQDFERAVCKETQNKRKLLLIKAKRTDHHGAANLVEYLTAASSLFNAIAIETQGKSDCLAMIVDSCYELLASGAV